MGLFDSLGGFFGSWLGGDEIEDAISDASKAQTQMYDQALAEQRRQYDTSRTDLMPWLTTGGSALGQLAQLYGLDTFSGGKVQQGGTPGDMSGFFKSPDYNFRLQQGTDQIDASAAARGMLDSGATRKAQIDYASNLASGEFQSYANRLAGIAGVGQSAGTTIGGFGQNSANQISGLMTNQGDNLASSYLARGMNSANQIGNMWGYGSQAAGGLFGSGNASSLMSMFGGGGFG